MKKIAATLLACAMLFTFANSTYASGVDLKHAVDEVVGTPYKWGGNTVKGFDCSGFILYIFNQYDVDLPRTSKAQSEEGVKVSKDELQPGDLVFLGIRIIWLKSVRCHMCINSDLMVETALNF